MITLESLGIEIPVKVNPKCYIIASGNNADTMALELANKLRKENIYAEADYSSRSIKAQMKTAGKLNTKYAIIIGDNEIENKTYTVKDMANSTQKNVPFDNIINYIKE